MLWLYNVPGRIFAEIGYLFPDRGQLWASGRRRESHFVHFIYSTIFYGICAAAIAFALTRPHVGWREQVFAKQQSGTASEQTADASVSTDQAPADQPPSAEANKPSPQSKMPDDVTGVTSLSTGAINENAESSDDPPSQSPELDAAIHRAFSTGNTQRWSAGRASGYAVPSSPSADGCRAIRYTVDQLPDAEPRSTTICP